MPLDLDDAISQLGNQSSPKRRAAAKRLRVLAEPKAGPALLEALQSEVADPRTWETQYQMIMALGACQHAPSDPFLEKLASRQSGYEMLGVALGDALVRIEWATSESLSVVERYIPNAAPGVIDGTFRAIAMLQLTPPSELMDRIVVFAAGLPDEDPLRYWVAAAAASWKGPNIEAFLKSCLTSTRSEIVKVSTTSLAGMHTKHNPL